MAITFSSTVTKADLKKQRQMRLKFLENEVREGRLSRRDLKQIKKSENLYTGSQVRPSTSAQILGKQVEQQTVQTQQEDYKPVFTEETIEAQTRPVSVLRPVTKDIINNRVVGITDPIAQQSRAIQPTTVSDFEQIERERNVKAQRLIQADYQKQLKEAEKRSRQGSIQAFTEKDIQKPTFLGITEPGFDILRKKEFELDKLAGTAETQFIRTEGSTGGLYGSGWQSYLKSAFYYGINLPIKAFNRPLRTTAILGSALLSRGIIGGSLFSAGQLTVGAISAGTAISIEKERQSGGTGARTFGELGFTLTAIGATVGALKVKSALLDKTSIKYNIYSKGKEAKEFTGVTEKGSILRNRPYKETFYTDKATTYRTIETGGKVLKITERPTFQAVNIFKNNKLVGSDFKYIDPGTSIQSSILPQITSRQTNFLDQSISSRTSKLSFTETTSGSLSKQYKQRSNTIKVDFKVADTFRRNVVATDQIIKVQRSDYRAVDFQKPDFAFGAKAKYPKDQVIIDQVGFGKNTQLQRTDIIAPKIVEKSVFYRTAVGTVEIKQEPILSRLSLTSLGKSGSLQLGSVQTLKPLITIAPSTSRSFKFNVPNVVSTGQSSSFTPIFSLYLDQKSKPKTQQTQIQIQRTAPKIDLGSLGKSAQQPRTVSQPKIDIGSITSQAVLQSQTVGLKQDTKQTAITTNLNVVNPNLKTSFGFNIDTPKTPVKVTPFKLPEFEFGLPGKTGLNERSKVSSKAVYRPSLEAIAFDVTTYRLPTNITPFSLRPKIKKNKTIKKKKKR